MSAKFFQFKKNLFITILLLVIFVLPNNALAENLLTVGSASSSLSGTDSAIFANIGSISATTTSLIRLQKNGVDLFKVDSTGNVTMGNFLTSINASNVSNGIFGSLSGGGNYSFPASLGIGVSVPVYPLHISSSGADTGLLLQNNTTTLNNSASLRFLVSTSASSSNEGARLIFTRTDSPAAADGDLSFWTRGNSVPAERMRITSNGNVGIGTTNPGAKLDVKGDALTSYIKFAGSGTGDIKIGTTGNAGEYGAIWLNQASPSTANYAFLGGGGITVFNAPSGQDMGFTIGNAIPAKMTLRSDGNVGIGTTTPQVTLDVNGLIKMRSSQITTTSDVINKGYLDSALETLSSSTNALNYWAANGTNIYNKNTGNVGIGTTAPNSKLHVRNLAAGVSNLMQLEYGTSNNDGANINYTAVNTIIGQIQHKRIGAGDYNLAFSNWNGSALAERMTIKSNGNVGIGTTTPNAALDIFGKAKITNNGLIYNTDSSRWLDMTGTNADSLRVPGDLHSTAGVLKTDGTGNNYMLGKLGLGISSPAGRLHLEGGDLFLSNGNYYNSAGARYGGKISLFGSLKGRQVNNNPDFSEGLYGYNVYDNASSGTVSLSLVSDSTAPNSSGRVMRLSVSGAGATPGRGGFYKATQLCSGTAVGHCLRQGNRHVIRIWAKIPADSSIQFASNSMGTGGSFQWISSRAGTGEWEEYIGQETMGAGASTTNFFYVENGAVPLTWDVASVEIIDIDSLADVDRAASLNVGYKNDVVLGNGNILSTAGSYFAVDGGSVGIGLTNPAAKLQINPGTNTEGLRIITSNYSPFVIRNASDTADIFRIDQNGNITGGIGNSSAWTRNNATSQLYVSNVNDNVGIGTTNPTEKLQISNGASQVASFSLGEVNLTKFTTAANGGLTINADVGGSDGTMSLQARNLTHIYLNGAGNVGIGTTNPGSYKLNIQGNSLINGSGSNVNGILSIQSTDTAARGTLIHRGYYQYDSQDSSGSFYQSWGMRLNGSDNLWYRTYTSANNYLPYTQLSTGGTIVFGGATSNLTTDTNPTLNPIMTINVGTGNVGIGTTTPSYKLDVAGDGSFFNGASPSQIHGVAAPTLGTDAANRNYVDGFFTTLNNDKLTARSISSLDVDTIGDNFVLYGGSTGSWTNKGPSGHNGGAILHIPTHSGGYYSDMWFDTANNRIYSRAVNAGTISNWSLLPKVYSATTNYLSKWSSADSLANSLVYDNGTNVGIGTSAPQYKLDVAGSLRSIGYEAALRVAGGNSDVPVFRVDSYNGSSDSANYGFSLKYMGSRAGNANSLSLFSDNQTGSQLEAITIYQNGSIGVGKTNPSYKLDVAGDASFSGYQIHNLGAPATGTDAVNRNYVDTLISDSVSATDFWKLNGSNLYASSTDWNVGIGTTNPFLGQLHVNKGTAAGLGGDLWITNNAVNTTGNSARLSFGLDNTTDVSSNAFIQAIVTNSSGYLTDLIFGTYGTGGLAERMRINSSGNVGIGNNLNLTAGGIIFNSNSTRWLDMTGTNADSLRVPGNIRLGDAARNVALGLGTNVANRASLTLNSTAGNPADIIFKNGSATIGNYGQWAISSRNGSSDYRFSIWRGSENGGVSTESEMFTISPSGNVGIGTTSPVYKLDVNGIINTATGFRIAGLAPSGQYLRGNGTDFVSSAIQSSDLPLNVYNLGQTYGYHQYGYSIGNGWYKIAETTFNGNCQGSNLVGDYQDLGYTTAARYIFNISSRGECDFSTNNESHHIDWNYQIDSTYDSNIDSKFRIVRTVNNTNSVKYELQVYVDTWDSGAWTFRTNGAWTIYNSPQTAGAPITSPTPKVNKLSNLNIYDGKLIVGSVGIGTTNPGAKLDVSGAFRSTSATISLLGNSGDRIVMTDNSGNLYATSTSVATGLPSPSGISGQTLRSNGTSWVANNVLYNNGTNVGIGTTNPAYKLQVTQNSNLGALFDHTGSSSGDIGINGGFVVINGYSNTVPTLAVHNAGTGPSAYFTGSVGIGTTAPGAILDVRGATNGVLRISTGRNSASDTGSLDFWWSGEPHARISASASGNTSNLHFLVRDGGTTAVEKMRIASNGNVGIATTTPQVTLDVNGLIKMRASNITTTSDVINKGYLDSALEAYGSSNNFWKLNGSNLYSSSTDWNVGIGTAAPSQQLEITKSFGLPKTTGTTHYGVIYKGGYSFIHDFNYGLNGNGVTTVGRNTFVGDSAGNFTMGSTATAPDQSSYNTGVGHAVLYNNTTGSNNSALGYNALIFNTTGSNNSAIGYYSLNANTTGYNNSAIGYYSLFSNTTGHSNSAMGVNALYANTTGNFNSAVGGGAGRYLASGAGRSTGNYGLYLGYNSRASADGMDNEIVIGYNAIGKGSNTATYGNSSMLKHIFEAGNVGIGTTTPGATLAIGNSLGLTSTGLIDGPLDDRYLDFSGAFTNSLMVPNNIITTAGKVGIGSNNPSAMLQISRGTNPYVTLPIINVIPESNYGIKLQQYHYGSGYDYYLVQNNGSTTDVNLFTFKGGNVGIGTSAPNSAYKLDVAGKINASELCIAGSCVANWGSVLSNIPTTTVLSIGGLNLNTTGNIVGVNKLTVGTIDPLYRIDGTNYSSFAAAIVGGVKEEYLGRVKISQAKGNEYEYRLDFAKLSAPDELWVWRQTVDFSPENVEVNLTPYGAFANIYYIIENEAIIFRADKPVTVSYRLSGKRVDWQNWPTKAKDQQEKPSFIINNGKVIK